MGSEAELWFIGTRIIGVSYYICQSVILRPHFNLARLIGDFLTITCSFPQIVVIFGADVVSERLAPTRNPNGMTIQQRPFRSKIFPIAPTARLINADVLLPNRDPAAR